MSASLPGRAVCVGFTVSQERLMFAFAHSPEEEPADSWQPLLSTELFTLTTLFIMWTCSDTG